MDIYDPAEDTWSQGPEMYCRRSTLGVGLLMNKIYAIGGFDGTAGLSSAEVFDLSTQKWQMIASMSTTRSSVGVVALDGFLYAIGGYSGQSRQCLDTGNSLSKKNQEFCESIFSHLYFSGKIRSS